MPKITLPKTVNDGTYDYNMVRPEQDVPDGQPGDAALYERVPPDPDYQFTPDLPFRMGKASVPFMMPIERAGSSSSSSSSK